MASDRTRLFNLRDSFESLYMRETTLRRYLKNADPTIHRKPDFIRVTTKIGGMSYAKYRNFWNAAGFEYDDIQSLARLWGLTYSGISPQSKQDKVYYIGMMNFIRQRVVDLLKWLHRKFELKETMNNEVSVSDGGDSFFTEADLNPNGKSAIVTFQPNEVEAAELTPDDHLQIHQDELQKALKTQEDPKLNEMERCRAERKADFHRRQCTAIESKQRQQASQAKKVLQEMKAALERDPQKYRIQLIHYATSPHVNKDVRKKALSFCRKYGIMVKEG